MLGLKWLPVDNGVHAGEVGDGAGVKLAIDVDKSAVVLGIVGAKGLSVLLVGHVIAAGVDNVVPAHWLERVCRANAKVV